MDIKKFLEELENKASEDKKKILFEGKENDEIPKEVLEALERYGLKKGSYKWAYKPDDYDLVVVEKSPEDWSILFLTEAEIKTGEEEEEDIFKESFDITEAANIGLKVIDEVKGDFLDIVETCIEIVSNKSYKGGFTASNIKALVK